MIFQAIDDKTECIGVYVDGKLHFDNFPSNLTKTWKYTGSIKDENVEYAWLYSNGGSLADNCSEELKNDLARVQKKMAAFYKSFKIAKIDLNEHCIFDLVPHDFLLDFCEVKNRITEHVFENFEKPDNYDHLARVQKLIHKIKYQKLNLSMDNCRALFTSTSNRIKAKELLNNYRYIDYNLFGTVTGRLTTCRDSFPILTMKKELRQLVKPTNDLFVSLDYNGAEVRMLLELCGHEQPKEDIHAWNIMNVFKDETLSRDLAKIDFFAWLYNPESDAITSNIYDREKVLDKYYDNGYISTPYGRKIKVEKRKALNYLIQSATSDKVLDRAVCIDKMLEGRKSFISHIVHDEIVIDYHDEDRSMIGSIKEMFEKDWLANITAGKDYYNLNELKI
tara:strand:+ start:5747 stop:6922 length:1176 start_codon:yes stop_codon:yes gene_type:complete